MKIEAYLEIIAPRWGKEEREYQTVPPRKPYVCGTGKNNALMHKIKNVRLRWWGLGPRGEYLVRLQSPRMLAVTMCERWIPLHNTKGKICELPKEDTVLCAKCHGKGTNFPRGTKHEVPLPLAKVRLGCVEEK
jgi:hypothetical protein